MSSGARWSESRRDIWTGAAKTVDRLPCNGRQGGQQCVKSVGSAGICLCNWRRKCTQQQERGGASKQMRARGGGDPADHSCGGDYAGQPDLGGTCAVRCLACASEGLTKWGLLDWSLWGAVLCLSAASDHCAAGTADASGAAEAADRPRPLRTLLGSSAGSSSVLSTGFRLRRSVRSGWMMV